MVSGVVVVDITHSQLVLLLALLDVILTLGDLVLQFPHLNMAIISLTPTTQICGSMSSASTPGAVHRDQPETQYSVLNWRVSKM